MTQSLVGVRERALAGALLLFIINFLGLGLGPLLTGILSDVIRTQLAARGLGAAQATADGLRYALLAMGCGNLWSALHYLRATRTLRDDLHAAAAQAGMPGG